MGLDRMCPLSKWAGWSQPGGRARGASGDRGPTRTWAHTPGGAPDPCQHPSRTASHQVPWGWGPRGGNGGAPKEARLLTLRDHVRFHLLHLGTPKPRARTPARRPPPLLCPRPSGSSSPARPPAYTPHWTEAGP